jgi:opacity protein-like surface antigen
MFNKKMIVAALGLAALMSGANAAENKYAGVAAGLSGIDYKVFGGYVIDPIWAVEASYVGIEKKSGNYGGAAYEAKATSFDLAAVYTLPFSKELNFHGKAGLGLVKVNASVSNYYFSESDSETKLGLVASAGASYKVHERIRVRADLDVRSHSDLSDKVSLSAGVQFAF